ncbi:MAG: hypothetical protein JWP87_5872, partial [Labilithrix sp.]|nr:hypothetical protein [Labilithrix sp.]
PSWFNVAVQPAFAPRVASDSNA